VNGERVESTHVPYTSVSVRAYHSPRELAVEALVDTGYTGFVVVPLSSFAAATAPAYRLRLQLADGSTVLAPAYRGELRIGTHTVADIAITELGDEAIIGMQVVGQFTLTIDHGRLLTLAL
jgi:predicted aspartyl protease